MPRIQGANLAEHRAHVWGTLVNALDELLQEREYDTITLTDIAARADVTRSTVYNYAADKSALLSAAVAESASAMMGDVTSIAAQRDKPAQVRITEIIHFLLSTFSRGSRRMFVLRATLGLQETAQSDTQSLIDDVQSALTALAIELLPSEDVHRVTRKVQLLMGVLERAVYLIALEPARAEEIIDSTQDLTIAGLVSASATRGNRA